MGFRKETVAEVCLIWIRCGVPQGWGYLSTSYPSPAHGMGEEGLFWVPGKGPGRGEGAWFANTGGIRVAFVSLPSRRPRLQDLLHGSMAFCPLILFSHNQPLLLPAPVLKYFVCPALGVTALSFPAGIAELAKTLRTIIEAPSDRVTSPFTPRE